MACGTPCVVVNAGGAPESVRDGVDGFLVDDDPAQMARAGAAPAGDARPPPAGCPRRPAPTPPTMTPEKVAGRMIALYEDLIATPGKKKQPDG